MFFVTGITGNVGGAAAHQLLHMGKQVRALVRNQAKAEAWANKGVELVEGQWEDAAALKNALTGVEGAYLMMPPIQTPSRDFREAKAVLASYVEALTAVPPKKVVALSSMGSEKSSGLGLITSTHLMEEALRDLAVSRGVCKGRILLRKLSVRSASGAGRHVPVFYNPTDRQLPMIATKDIGAEVAKLLTTSWTGKRVIELGSLLSPDELARQLGEVLGREVKAQVVPRAAWAEALEHMGLPKGQTWGYEEMIEGVNSGLIAFGVQNTEHVEGTTSAKEVFSAAGPRTSKTNPRRRVRSLRGYRLHRSERPSHNPTGPSSSTSVEEPSE